MTNLCTLFDSNYLDKGIVLYHSLENVSNDFQLYVLAMNDKCREVLEDLNLPYLKIITLTEFENEELLKAKNNRSRGEYCWTCSSSLIKYLLTTYKLDTCTYVDVDMMFYKNPQILIDEMLYAGASVQIVEHRFEKNNNLAQKVGKYCVEFNTFKNDEDGLRVLDDWRRDCLESCAAIDDGIHWGDQKYLDKWIPKYGDKIIHVLQNLGAGVAPWNVNQYRHINTIGNNIILQERASNKYFELVFYHFEAIQYDNRNSIFAGGDLGNQRKSFIAALYADYLIKIEEVKKMLECNYNINNTIKYHPVLAEKNKGYLFYIKRIWFFFSHPRKGFKRYKTFINGHINI